MSLSTTLPDLLRLLVVPVFAWVAYRDIRTRRVSSTVWIPLSVLGAVALVWDGWRAWTVSGGGTDATIWFESFLLPAAVSLGVVVPIAYLFWWFGGFGGADAKALMTIALLFPTVPAYGLGSTTLPLTSSPIGAFSFTILTNAVLVGLAIPLALAARNATAGRIAPVMVIGWPVSWSRVPETHGLLLETPTGRTRDGLDLDALRMYLRWRGTTLPEIRAEPDSYRDPASLPEEPNPPTDGAVGAAGESSAVAGERTVEETGDVSSTLHERTAADDPWGAAAFLEAIDRSAYGTDPEQLREGIEVLVEKETVWVSPGTPFLVPVFLGLVIALVYGDLLFGLLI